MEEARRNLQELLVGKGWKRVRDDLKKSRATIDVWETSRVRIDSDGKSREEPYRMWRCIMELAASVSDVEQWVTKPENLKEWNPVLEESKILKKIDTSNDIIAYTFKPLASGLISPREFTVHCRRESLPDQSRLLTAIGHNPTAAKAPTAAAPQGRTKVKGAKGVVRGWTGPSGFLLESIHPNRCRMVWILNSDSRLPKSIPKLIADQAFVKLLVTMLRKLRAQALKK